MTAREISENWVKPEYETQFDYIQAIEELTKAIEEYGEEQADKVKNNVALDSVSQQRELLEAYQHFIDWNEEHNRKASTSERIEAFIASNCG